MPFLQRLGRLKHILTKRGKKVFLSIPVEYGAKIKRRRMYFKKMMKIIKELGFFIVNENIIEETDRKASRILFLTNLLLIDISNYILMDITFPSFGVGYECCYALKRGKKVICFYNSKITNKVSLMIRGNPSKNLFCISYKDFRELKNKIKSLLK